MAKELFRTANASNIKNILQKAAGLPVSNLSHFPKSCQVNDQKADQWAKLDLEYGDFKEAFSRFNLIARTCGNIGYYPEIFNVYNRISVKLFSTEHKTDKALTLKDLYMSFFLN